MFDRNGVHGLCVIRLNNNGSFHYHKEPWVFYIYTEPGHYGLLNSRNFESGPCNSPLSARISEVTLYKLSMRFSYT